MFHSRSREVRRSLTYSVLSLNLRGNQVAERVYQVRRGDKTCWTKPRTCTQVWTKASRRTWRLNGTRNCPRLLLAGFLRRPVGPQFRGQLCSRGPAKCRFPGFGSGSAGTRCWFGSTKVRPSRFLRSRNLPFHRRAHGPLFRRVTCRVA